MLTVLAALAECEGLDYDDCVALLDDKLAAGVPAPDGLEVGHRLALDGVTFGEVLTCTFPAWDPAWRASCSVPVSASSGSELPTTLWLGTAEGMVADGRLTFAEMPRTSQGLARERPTDDPPPKSKLLELLESSGQASFVATPVTDEELAPTHVAVAYGVTAEAVAIDADSDPTVRRYLGQLVYCGEKVAKTHAGHSGTYDVRFVVADARIAEVTAEGPLDDLSACLVAKVRRWRMPPEVDGPQHWRFTLAPR